MSAINDPDVQECIDCGKDWSMTPQEVSFFMQMMEEQPGQWRFPRRCLSCRKKKREATQ